MNTFLKIVGGIVGVSLAVLAIPLYAYFPGHNWRTVEKGAFYGSRQMSGAAIKRYAKKHNIQTLLNMRGQNPGSSWYDEEARACAEAGIAHESFGWSKNSLPDPGSLARFISVLETGSKPFLAHCQGGTHRTGVAAAVYLLLKGADVATARKQFGPMFNDAPIGELLALYERGGAGRPFKQWVLDAYPAAYAAHKAAKDAAAAPAGAVPAPAPAG